MDVVKYFDKNTGKCPVTIMGTCDDPLFRADEISKILEIKNFTMSLKHFDVDEKIYKDIDTPIGKRRFVFLTEEGLYRFITMSRKPFAKQFQKWMFSVVKEIRINGKYELKSDENKMLIEKDLFEMSKKMERHRALIQGFKEQNVVYICEMTERCEDNMIIKIGETCDISERISCLTNQYGQPMYVLDVFKCENNHDFEQFIHKLPVFVENKFNGNFQNGTSSKETYIIQNDFTLEYVKKTLKKNIEPFEKISREDYLEYQRLEIEKMKLDLENKKLDMMVEIHKSNKKMFDECPNYIDMLKNMSSIFGSTCNVDKLKDIIDNKQMLDKNQGKIFIKEKVSNSPSVQQYDSDKKLIKYYNSIISCIRENNGISASGLKFAVKNKSEYHGYRWALIPRNEDPTVKIDIGETKVITKQRREIVAFLNLDKNRIIKLYPDQKSIAHEYQISYTAVSCAIKRGSRSQGGYFVFYDDCSDELKDAYDGEIPELTPPSNSTQINQINPITNQTIKVFRSVSDVVKDCQVSRLSLKSAINDNTVLKGFKWSVA